MKFGLAAEFIVDEPTGRGALQACRRTATVGNTARQTILRRLATVPTTAKPASSNA